MIQSYKLPNKLKVLFVENHKAPVVTIQAWVRTGSADEVKGQEGLSHFIEHLLFKGTQKYKVGEIAKLIEGAGGELNAYTSFDQTVFYMTLSSQYIEFGIEAMAEMIGRPLFDRTEIDNEREVVIEEIKRSNDSPARKSSQLLFSSVYESHPYGRPVIGYDEVVKKTPPQKIKELFYNRYCPENMYLIIAGDFDLRKTKKMVKENFSDLKGQLKKIKRPKERRQSGPKLKLEKSKFNESYLNIAWKTLGASEKELLALDMLSYIYAYGDNTRLIQALRIKNQYVNELGASQFTPKDEGFFSITAYLDLNNLQSALGEVANEIFHVFVEQPAQEELTRAISQLESTEHYQESIDALARKIGNDEFMHGDPEYFKKYLKKIKSLKPKDISAVVKKYLQPQFMTVTLVHPEKEKNVDVIINEWIENYGVMHEVLKNENVMQPQSHPILAIDFSKRKTLKKTQDGVKKILHDSGAQIILKPIENTSVISVRTGFLGGLRADPANKAGVSDLISKVWLCGTHARTENEISNFMESNAAYMSAFSGRNSFGAHFQILNCIEGQVEDIWQDTLLNPQFPEFQFQRELAVQINQLRSLEDHPSSLVFIDFMKCLFGSHPYSHEPHGNLESMKMISRDDALKIHRNLVTPQNMTIVIAGGLDEQLWIKNIDNLISKMRSGEKYSKKFDHDPIQKNQKTFRVLNKEQSHLVYGFKGLSIKDERRHTLQVLQTVLSGQGGRLFMNLRDKASLAYSVSPVRMDGIETGYFGAYIGCSPNKAKKAIEMMAAEFEDLVQNKIPEEELERAKKNIIGKHDIGMQKTSHVSSNIMFDEIYGIAYKTPKEYAEVIKSISTEDIKNLATELFSQHSVISCVGAECPWD